jgi:hypothetical protein
VAEEAEKELSSIFVADAIATASSSSGNVVVLSRGQSPSPSLNVMESPSPKRQFSSSSPFSPLSRAQNPNLSPCDDGWTADGAELGLLALSPERSRHKRLSGGASKVLRMYN